MKRTDKKLNSKLKTIENLSRNLKVENIKLDKEYDNMMKK